MFENEINLLFKTIKIIKKFNFSLCNDARIKYFERQKYFKDKKKNL